MDPALYKTHTTSRGTTYAYYFSPARGTQQTLLLLHGFPSTSADWHKQVAYFTARGYGALVPDMLGYGGSDKPTLAELDTLRPSLMAQDMLELLEKEHVGRAVSIGHDWGSMVNSRVAQLFSARFDGFGFLALGYMPPNPTVDLNQVNALTKQHLGYQVFGYAFFHAESGAADLIEAHWDSYLSLIFPADPASWKRDLAPIGAMKAWLEADRQSPLPAYLDAAEKQRISDALLTPGGLRSPLLWYNVAISGLQASDDKSVPEASYAVKKPVFVGAATQDYVCLANNQIADAERFCPQRTVKTYDGDHWIMWSHAEQMNRDLLAWLEELPKAEL